MAKIEFLPPTADHYSSKETLPSIGARFHRKATFPVKLKQTMSTKFMIKLRFRRWGFRSWNDIAEYVIDHRDGAIREFSFDLKSYYVDKDSSGLFRVEAWNLTGEKPLDADGNPVSEQKYKPFKDKRAGTNPARLFIRKMKTLNKVSERPGKKLHFKLSGFGSNGLRWVGDYKDAIIRLFTVKEGMEEEIGNRPKSTAEPQRDDKKKLPPELWFDAYRHVHQSSWLIPMSCSQVPWTRNYSWVIKFMVRIEHRHEGDGFDQDKKKYKPGVEVPAKKRADHGRERASIRLHIRGRNEPKEGRYIVLYYLQDETRPPNTPERYYFPVSKFPDHVDALTSQGHGYFWDSHAMDFGPSADCPQDDPYQ